MRIGEILNNTYRLERLLGESGMGLVFEARGADSARRLAVKYIPPHVAARSESVQRFLLEAGAPGELGLPQIPRVLDRGITSSGAPFLVRDYFEGSDLSEYRERHGGRLSPSRAIPLIRQVCQGLAAVHQQGIFHLDLKPQNIFVARDPRGSEAIKLLDFGVAGLRDALGEEAGDATVTGQVIGLPHYMPLEQARGALSAGHLVDIYALGAILYELLAGVRPFDADNYPMLLLQIATSEAPALLEKRPELGAPLCEVVHRAMAREASNRFASLEELSAALTPFETLVLPEGAPPPKPPRAVPAEPQRGSVLGPTAGRPRRDRRWVLVGVLTGVALLLGAITVVISLAVLREPPAELAAQDRSFTDDRAGEGWGDRCFYHHAAKRLSNARAACLRGLEVAQESEVKASLYYNLGLIWMDEGSRWRARSYFRKALEARPNYSAAQDRLGEL